MVPRTHFFGKNGPPLEIWSGLCKLERQSLVHLIHVRKSFPCLLLLHFHTSVFPSGAFLWLVGKFSARTAPGASARAPIKAHHRFVSRKTSYLGRFFSFVVTYLGCLMLLTTCSAEPYPFHKRQLRSNIVLVLGLLFQVRTKFFRRKWSGRTIIPGILVPRTNFFAGPKFPWQTSGAFPLRKEHSLRLFWSWWHISFGPYRHYFVSYNDLCHLASAVVGQWSNTCAT